MRMTRISRRGVMLAAGAGVMGGLLQRGRAVERGKFNRVIDGAWEAGLAEIKPSEKELERGLRLHEESLVFDCYGFSPRSAVDGEAIAKASSAGASDAELDDMREEMGMIRCATNAVERAEFEMAWRAAG